MSTDISSKQHHHRRNSNEQPESVEPNEQHKRVKKVKHNNEEPQAEPTSTIRKSKITNEQHESDDQSTVEKERHKRVKKVKQQTEQVVIDQPVVTQVARRGRKVKYTTDEDRIAARRQQQREYRARKKQEMEDLRSFKQMNESKDPPTKQHKSKK